MVSELLEYTRATPAEQQPEEVNPWLADLLDQMEVPDSVEVVREFSEEAPTIRFDAEKLRRVMLNLLENAIQAVKALAEASPAHETPYHPRVSVTTSVTDGDVRIEIQDNGVGMDEQTAHRDFEPLFTTRARGTGLGLAVVRKIVEEHGGSVSMESEPNRGTRATVRIPLSRDREDQRVQDTGTLEGRSLS